MNYADCGWGYAEVDLLSSAIEWAHANGATAGTTTLNLSSNNHTDETVIRLAKALDAGALPDLLGLYLDRDHESSLTAQEGKKAGWVGLGIGDAGAQSLAAVLPRLTSILDLKLECNLIGDAGAQIIAAAIPRQLRELRLSHNRIGDAGVISFIPALSNGRLKVLSLSNNAITDAGVREFTRSIGNGNSSLKELYLFNKTVSKEAVKAFSDASQLHGIKTDAYRALNSDGEDEGGSVAALPKA